MKFKKLVIAIAFLLASITAIQPLTAFASGYDDGEIVDTESFIEEYNITLEEAENLSENLENAIKQLPTLDVGETVEVPVSENLILEAFLEDNGMGIASPFLRATYTRTITSTLRLKNIYGGTVVTLNSVGVFSTNGSKSTPKDAYGTHSAIVWNVTNKSSVKGAAAYNAYVRNAFTGKFDLGVSPVSMTIQTFSYSCLTLKIAQ